MSPESSTFDIGNLIAADYFNPSETAEFLKLKNRRTLIRWQKSGIGPPRTKVGRRILYRKTSLIEWLTRQEEKPGRVRNSAKRKK